VIDHIVAFMLMAVLDMVWAYYIMNTSKANAISASAYAAALFGLSGIVTIQIVDNPSLLPAAMLGAFVGTYIAIKRGV
jgi:uncharacterized membrane protein YfcA